MPVALWQSPEPLCLIMGLLDMKGLIGAAIMGTLMYDAGQVWAGRVNFYLHDHDLGHSPPDTVFIDMLNQLWCVWDCDNTRRVSPFRRSGLIEVSPFCLSEFPCYLVWPQREQQSYVLLDTAATFL